MTRKLVIPPDSSSYAAQRGAEVLAVQLDGGASRIRADILGASYLVSVQWIVDPAGYDYLNAFFRTATTRGSASFTIDLVLDNSTLSEYSAIFTPSTFKLASQVGLSYTVTAQLEVIPSASGSETDDDNALMDAYEASL